MNIFPNPKIHPSESLHLSMFSPQAKSIQQASPFSTRIFMRSSSENPLFLIVQSADTLGKKRYKFTAGEHYRSAAIKTYYNREIPEISNFDIENSNSSEIQPIIKEDSQLQCRICLENDKIDDLISPCLCRGSHKSVHQNCLKMWLLRSEKNEKELTYCEVCKGQFSMSFVYSYEFSMCSNGTFRFWVPIGVFLGMICLIVCFSVEENINRKVSITAKVFLYTLLVFIAIMMLIVGVFFRRKICKGVQVRDWKILNYQERNIFD